VALLTQRQRPSQMAAGARRVAPRPPRTPGASRGAPFQGAARNHLPEVGRLRVLCRRVDAVADIVGHVAFYTDRVDVVVGT
jgi:hypothetical protein